MKNEDLTSPVMIKANDISKAFSTLQVLKNVSLHVDKGEIVSITGPSGAGKTTLLQILGTLDSPDSGQVIINSTDISTLTKKQLAHFRNQHIGFVFQFHQLLPEFTAEENIMLPALIKGCSRKQAQTQAQRLLEIVSLADRSRHKPAALSGGEKQRVAVARALVNSPDIILADEPTGSLDTTNKNELTQLFVSLKEQLGQTIIIVTHDMQLAAATDRIIKLKDGEIQP